jgi:hypothetical protein
MNTVTSGLALNIVVSLVAGFGLRELKSNYQCVVIIEALARRGISSLSMIEAETLLAEVRPR